jgi:glycine/D-amino acid oxidase-like deaminating enzyme
VSATQHRDLRTGRSVWEGRRLPPLPGGALGRRRTADVLVVGAGISGAMVADALSEAGLRVLVVDRRRPLVGSTSASTALLQYDLDLPLVHLARRIGHERAVRVWRRSKLALDALRERARRLSIAADCVERDSLYLDGNVLGAAELREEAEARRRAGFEVSLLPPREVAGLYGIRGRSALLSRGNLAADPRRLAHGFLRAAVDRGADVAWPVEIAKVQARARGVRAQTVDGQTIEARHLVFATGYELPKGVPRAGHSIVSTWAIATRPQPRRLWPGQCFIWEASDPYLYIRADPEGRVICGGEDEEFADSASRDALLPAKTKALERKLQALLPGIDARAAFAWCGSFGASTTGTPSIGPVPGMASCYAVMGYGGNGITFSALAAQVLRSRILGTADPDADLFSFRRARH